MAAITTALAHVVDALTAAGIPATIDASQIQIPGAWVTLESIEPHTLAGGSLVTAQVVLVAMHPNAAHAFDALDQMAAAASQALGDQTWAAESITLPNHSPDPLPAIAASIELEVN